MPARLNHTIVYCSDQQASASFLADVLGLAAPRRYGPFSVVQVANGVSLDFLEEVPVHPQHYAFLVDEGRGSGGTLMPPTASESRDSWLGHRARHAKRSCRAPPTEWSLA